MGTENWKKQRSIAHIPVIANKIYIFCEGKKTEPNYFVGIKNKIEEKGIYKNSIIIEIKGIGEGTVKIVEYAEKYIKKHKIQNAEIWFVYDKDDFKDADFNNVAIKANALNQNKNNLSYHVAWSNQCIEYWFILHFDYYIADNDRAYYIDYLNKKFKNLGIEPYSKNDKEIFNKLETYGCSDKAERFAVKRLKDLADLPDSKTVPATKVHMLYQQLKKYF